MSSHPLGMGSLTHTPAALGSATWPWYGDWFGRFCHTREQWEGWEIGWGWPEEAVLPCPCPLAQIPASLLLPFPPFSREASWGARKQKARRFLVLVLPFTWYVTVGKPLSLLAP